MAPPLDPCISEPCDARCCDAFEVPLLETDIRRIEERTGRARSAFVEDTPDGWRVLSGTGLDGCVFRGAVTVAGRSVTGCTIHDARPEACRFYPFVLREGPQGAPEAVRDSLCPFANGFAAPDDAARRLADLERRLEEERREEPT